VVATEVKNLATQSARAAENIAQRITATQEQTGRSVASIDQVAGAMALVSGSIGAIHDENMNGKLDTNWAGVPTEGYGFSNNAKGVLGAPSFEAASFSYDGRNVDLTMSLRY